MQRNLEKKKSRRSFLNFVLGGGLFSVTVSILYPVYRFMIPPSGVGEAAPQTIPAGKVNDIKPNSGKIIRFGTYPVILLKTPEGDLKAFSAICTHLGCIVQYREDLGHIWCACHNGHFDLNGINIAGPPPRPLKPYDVNIRKDEVFVSKAT